MGNCCNDKEGLHIKLEWELPKYEHEDSYLKSEFSINNHQLLSPIKKKHLIQIHSNRVTLSNHSIPNITTEAFIRNKTKKSLLKIRSNKQKNIINRQHFSSQCVHRNALLKNLSDRNNTSKQNTNAFSNRRKTNESIGLSLIDKDDSNLNSGYENNDLANNNNTASNNKIDDLYKEKIIEKEFSREEQMNLISILNNHYILRHFTCEGIINIIENMTEFQIDKEMLLFREGDEAYTFYLIKEGKVKLFTEDTEKILGKNESFGEIALVPGENKRKYSAKAITTLLTGYLLEQNIYQMIIEDECSKKQSQALFHFDNIFIFKSITNVDKNKLNQLMLRTTFNKNDLIKLINSILIIETGITQYTSNNCNGNYALSQNMTNILTQLFGSSLLKKYEIKAKDDNTQCIQIPENSFIEVIGLNYKHVLIVNALENIIGNDILLSKIQKETKLKASQLLKAFKLKEYKNKETVLPKGALFNNPMAIINGELATNKAERTIIAKNGDFFNHSVLLKPKE